MHQNIFAPTVEILWNCSPPQLISENKIREGYIIAAILWGMSVGWDVKWCPMTRVTNPLALKRPFHWISVKSRLVRDARETSKFQN